MKNRAIQLLLVFYLPAHLLAQGWIIPSGITVKFDSGFILLYKNGINNGNYEQKGGLFTFAGETQSWGGNSDTYFDYVKINSSSNTTIASGSQYLKGIITCNGTLNANNHLTLLSDANQTALVAGNGTGEVVGKLTMQRYLESGFGYKYFSSPFKDATVGEFSDDMNLMASFPTFYGYNEDKVSSGWVKYINPLNLLLPLQGYAVNFGTDHASKTVDVKGVVNNGMLEDTLYNHAHPYTLGFNLFGNPYPSPIDWESQSGWTKTNIDNALYFFDAGTTNQYLGTYSTYINGISSNGMASKYIPSMQAAFIHVSDGFTPVMGKITMNNSVRVDNFSPYFHKATIVETRPIIKISAGFQGFQKTDPAVLYIEQGATPNFEGHLDAMKLMNTDSVVPNFYFLTSESKRVAIDAIPPSNDSIRTFPLGLSLMRGGIVSFKLDAKQQLPTGLNVYFRDASLGIIKLMEEEDEYSVALEPGEFTNRFFLTLSYKDPRYTPEKSSSFYAYCIGQRLSIYSCPGIGRYSLTLYNLNGSSVFRRELECDGYQVIALNIEPGIYMVQLTSSGTNYMKKVFVNN